MKLRYTVVPQTITVALLLSSAFISEINCHSKTIAVLGTGYVGLVTGAGLSLEHTVICCDIDQRKIDLLNNGIIPIVEENLDKLVHQNVAEGRLSFSSDIDAAIGQAEIVIIAVGTPMADDGQADLSEIKAVARTIGKNLNNYKVIVTKSTVPIGTGKLVTNLIAENAPSDELYDVVSNPEFLREGQAVHDFLHPDRIVIGANSEKAYTIMHEVYEPWLIKVPMVTTNLETAEAIKYAANAFLAVKISFINEFANLCDATNADVLTVAKAMGLDERIGSQFLKPGPGYGGSCFPKDTQALAYMADQAAIDLHVVKAAITANDHQRSVICKKIDSLAQNTTKGITSGITVALLGLTFKAHTDDVRYSPAIAVIDYLKTKDVHIKAYDPAGMDSMKKVHPDIGYCSSWQEAVTDADMVLVITDWDEFKWMDLNELALLMRGNAFLDARNIWNPDILRHHGFEVQNIGRKH